tara:strand:- start:3638 stop:5089 length:1452 start_codon:yes stop_codon:yes gene_type:complete
MNKIFLLLICFLFNYSDLNAQFFGGLNNDKGVAFCNINQDLFLTATTRSFGQGSEDIWLIKVNDDLQFEKAIEWGGVHHDIVADIIATYDEGVVLMGYSWDAPGSRTGIVIAKYDKLLNNQWISYISGQNNDLGYGLIETKNHEFLAVGLDKSQGELGACSLIKIDENGVLKWQKFYDTPNKDIGMDVLELNDGSLLVLVNVSSFEGKISNSSDYLSEEASRFMLIKTDSLGNEIWRNYYEGDKHSFGNKIISDSSENLFVVGSSMNNLNGSFDVCLHKLDQLGSIIWRKTFGGSSYDYGNSIDINNAGEILLIGYSNYSLLNENPDLYVLKLDANGNEIWTLFFGSENSEYGNDGCFLNDGSALILGTSKSTFDGNADVLFFKTNADGMVLDTLKNTITKSDNTPLLFPNPASLEFSIFLGQNSSNETFNLILFDISGKEVLNETFNNRVVKIPIEKRLKRGMYLYTIHGLDENYSGKLIIN